MSESMRDDESTATTFKSETGGTARQAARPGKAEPNARQAAATTRHTVGVYERPAQRGRLSLPLVVILILSALVSAVVAARFLF